MIGRMEKRPFTILFVGDSNLGERGLQIVRRRFPETIGMIWPRGDLIQRHCIRHVLRSQKWDILLSFYNDLVFQDADLSQADLPLNIHPSLPALRGVGYDTLPLIEGHKTCGATLHLMTREIDAGKILDILECDIPEQITGMQFRRLTQDLSLAMLQRTVAYLGNHEDLPLLYATMLLETWRQRQTWGAPFYSRKRLNNLLEKWRRQDPHHLVFK